MPFTISHAAAVLPLRKATRLPLAALMIGSMSPDFSFFIPGSMDRDTTHSFTGILMFCWPVSLAMWMLFVHILERPTIELLPEAWRARVPRSDRAITAKNLAYASLAVILGAITHVAWDAFTHGGTPVTTAFPALSAELFTYRGRTIHVHFVLQLLCSVLGLLALANWALNLRREPARAREARLPRSPITDRARIGAALVVFASSGATALLGYASYAGSRFENRFFYTLIGGMTGWALAWCAVAVFVSLWMRAVAPSAKWSAH